jgi:hypothetical protein
LKEKKQGHKWFCLFSIHAHAIYGGVPVWAEPFDICYFAGKLEEIKNYPYSKHSLKKLMALWKVFYANNNI